MSSFDSKEALERELTSLQAEYRRVLDSTSYRVGRLLVDAVRSPRAMMRLPLECAVLIRELLRRRQPPAPGSAQYQETELGWKSLKNFVRSSGKKDFVFLFSGTACVQDTRGNRPIRQTQALLAKGVPVFFSYHRSRFDEELPSQDIEGLAQSPIDITLQLLDDIAAADFGEGVRRLFIVSYPYKGIERYVDVFRRNGWAVVYDCRDDWEEFALVGMAPWFSSQVEQNLVARVDRTFCVSRPLVAKMRDLAPGSCVELMPNAVEADFLPAGYRREPEMSPQIVGYFGHLSAAWFDWESFIEVARVCSQYRFEVIGHSAPEGLDLPKNIILLGPRPWQELHRYAARWSAAVIPFRMGRLADGVDPIKIYEYLSFGLPVVSFLMPQINDYPYTTTVNDVEAFCAALEKACKEVPKFGVIEEFLSRNTWEVRAEKLLSVVGESGSC